jgi:RNase H-fold protein (predicted Holliday junction resolvase)
VVSGAADVVRDDVNPSEPLVVLSIDPGTTKCGIAVVARDADKCRTLHREVTPTERLVVRVMALLGNHPGIGAVLMGNATNGARLARAVRAALMERPPVYFVEEAFTSQRARSRFQIENPPRGWNRLVPAGMRTPPLPYDDYVAVLLAEDWFAGRAPTPDSPL